MNLHPISLVLGAALVALPSVSAVEMAADEVIPGINGKIVVGEFNGEDGFGHYLVDLVDESVTVAGFAVSSDAPNAAAFREGWEGTHFTLAQWDVGSPVGTGTTLKTTDLGSFASLFGTAESGANVYFGFGDLITGANDHDQVTPGVWNSEPEFVFFGDLASHFIAFGNTGTIVDQSIALPDGGTTLGFLAISLSALAALKPRRN